MQAKYLALLTWSGEVKVIDLGGFEIDNAAELLPLPTPIVMSDAHRLW